MRFEPDETKVETKQFFDILGSVLRKFGEAAEEQLRFHDFGEAKITLAEMIQTTARELNESLAAVRTARNLGVFCGRYPELADAIIHRPKALARFAGSLLLTQLTRPWMTPDEVQAAWSAKLAFIVFADALDDLVDQGKIAPSELERVFRSSFELVFQLGSDMEGRWLDVASPFPDSGEPVRNRARGALAALHELLGSAKQLETVLPALQREADCFVRAQRVAVLLRDPNMTTDHVRGEAAELPSPFLELPWFDRLAKSLTWVTSLTLIDLAFSGRLPPEMDQTRHLRAWYLLDSVLGGMDHLHSIQSDRAAGILNIAALALTHPPGPSGRPARAAANAPSVAAYEGLLEHWADLSVDALAVHSTASAAGDQFYRNIAVAIPLVMLQLQSPGPSDLLHAYLRIFAAKLRRTLPTNSGGARPDPTGLGPYHSARYSQQGSPERTHLDFTTRPSTFRLFRTPS